jgi:DnaJ-class molecular chaperone
MNKLSIKTIGSILTVGLFLFFAFASTDDKNDENSSSPNNESVQNQNTNEATEQECYKCNGFGHYTPKAPPGFVNKTVKCEACDGTGKSSD